MFMVLIVINNAALAQLIPNCTGQCIENRAYKTKVSTSTKIVEVKMKLAPALLLSVSDAKDYVFGGKKNMSRGKSKRLKF